MNAITKKFPLKVIIAASTALVLIIAAIVAFSVYNGTRGEAIRQEQRILGQYEDNKNELSAYVLSFNESLGIADRQSDKLNEILAAAVQGRYDGQMAPGTGGELFSAITEAYPDLTATSESYQRVQDLVVSGREAFKNKQTKLIDLIRAYTTWSNSDVFRSWVLDTFVHAPTDTLIVVEGNDTHVGQEALNHMSRIIVTSQVTDIYEQGEQEPLITPSEDDSAE